MLKATDVVVKDIPQYHPLSVDYKNFWREQRRKCIEGAWASGMYIPPALYYYVNFHTIRLNKKGSALKTFDRPWLRDVEYRFFNYYTEARGFSGFADDDEYSSNIILLDEEITDDILMQYYPNTMSSSTGQRKTYIPARKALFQTYEQPLGRALFENPLQNFMLLGSRESGKSYMVSSLIGHNFLMDGATAYNEFTRKYPDPAEILVGAEKSDRSADLLKKVRDAFDHLPGKQSLYDRTYPSPFLKRYRGSWEVNKEIVAEYKRREQGAWVIAGSKSSIKHRSFAANSFAAQGTRPLLLVLEEAGMFSGLKDVYANTVDNLRNGLRKTGMLMMLGCVCAGTKVWTHDGRLINIEDVTKVEGILGYAGIGVTKEPILHLNPPAKKPCVRITTKKGDVLECSEDHPLLWSSNRLRKQGRKVVTFKRAIHVKPGDQLMSMRQIPSFGDKRMLNPRLIGLLIGDGNYSKRTSPSLAIEGEDIYEWLKLNYNDFNVVKERLTKKGLIFRQVTIRNLIGQLRELELYGQS